MFFAGGAFFANAQMMQGMGGSDIDLGEVREHTAKEEKEGGELWQKLQAKEIVCSELTDGNFEAIGEYLMGLMMGESHAAMNAMMMQMHGEEGEEQIHLVMGKRLSGCDTFAVFSGESAGWMPMLNMMSGGWSSSSDRGFDGHMSRWGAFGSFGLIFMVLWWVIIIGVVVALLQWLVRQARGSAPFGSPLDMVKGRYAKGEITKDEFDRIKKDIQ